MAHRPADHSGATAHLRDGSDTHSKNSVRLWLRLLTCTAEVEQIIRTHVRTRFGTTLPRFDILSALDRNVAGLSMGELSDILVVSNGNVTGVVERLVTEGMVDRQASPVDRRKFTVSLTAKGKARFAQMAREHEAWVDELFAGLSNAEIADAIEALGRVRQSVAERGSDAD